MLLLNYLLHYSQNSNRTCRNAFLFLCGRYSVSDVKIFVNNQEGFALMYLPCLRNKDIYAEDFSYKS